jgi:Lipid desaturase domain
MSTLTLPDKSPPLIVASAALLGVALYVVSQHPDAGLSLAVLAFLASGLIGDAFTGLAHFSFDYVFPYDFPIFGPIAKEFNEHHAAPDLDPSAYGQNFTKGAYASLPTAALTLGLTLCLPATPATFFIEAAVCGLAVWALFFHQIHSYCHMGSRLDPDLFNRRIAGIGQMADPRQQRLEIRALFETVPIPRAIRALQRCGLLLNPESHNLHHIRFESDFSSVNGWSDPFLNPFLGPLARRYKRARGAGRAPPAMAPCGDPRPQGY